MSFPTYIKIASKSISVLFSKIPHQQICIKDQYAGITATMLKKYKGQRVIKAKPCIERIAAETTGEK